MNPSKDKRKKKWETKCDCGEWICHSGKHENKKCPFCKKMVDVFSIHRKHKEI